jgi:hypothetical protein
VEILLNSFKNIRSVNVDNFDKFELRNNPALLNEYDIRNVLSVTEIFDAEREANPVYRIYGKVEYMSLLNGLRNNYYLFQDFFSPQTTSCKNLLNSFDFYLVKAGTGYTHVISGGSNVLYQRFFTVIATPANFELYPAGFSNNVYGEQAYAFSFNTDFDIENFYDNFGFPATELFLYAQYKPATSPAEVLSMTTWSPTGVKSVSAFTPATLNTGDTIQSLFFLKIGDMIEYSLTDFLQVPYADQTFYIQTPYQAGRLIWKYNPLIPFRLQYFAEQLNIVNTGSTSYEQTSTIPSFATRIPNTDNFVWRYLQPQGYFDPLTNLGVDYPFVNKKRYLFSNIVLDVVPDLNDTQTLAAFAEVWYTRNATKINVTPLGDINNIGKPCR